ncbi:MAG: GTP-binding protein [Nanoarchaeota archaeon]|nr:GTP-binding protein [Nanoarchaeota archaeon]
MSIENQIKDIEAELAKMKYNKATQFHFGKLRAKLAKLKNDEQKRHSGGARGLGYGLKKRGDATVVFVGYPSAGKSTLLNLLTNAESKVAAYEFTTLTVVPGVLEYDGARIQLWDVPGLVEAASAGRGRGKEVLSVIRVADAIVMLLAPRADVSLEEQYNIMLTELINAGIRPNQTRPDIAIEKREGGGITIAAAVALKHLDRKTIIGVLHEFGIMNAEVTFREDPTLDRLIDALSPSRVYVPLLVIVNKLDLLPSGEQEIVQRFDATAISATEGTNINQLRDAIWNRLGLIRIFLKKEGQEPDLKEPLILKAPATVRTICETLHKDVVKNVEYARLWGPSAKFGGQKIGIDFKIKDKDIIELHIR